MENGNEMIGGAVGPEIREIFALFFDAVPAAVREIDTSIGDDFRKTFLIETEDGDRRVLKIAANDFTVPDRIRVWKRTIEEYRKLGYYCPPIFCDKRGGFPAVDYAGRKCTAYAEEYSKYMPAEDRAAGGEAGRSADRGRLFHDVWVMTAKVAAKRFDYTDLPSAYCLFETFSPGEETDEVLENALAWKEYAKTLSGAFADRVRRIWELWSANREALGHVYGELPTSVFQADLNGSNVLVDGDGRLAGVCDFNLCGRDVFLNYLMRENYTGEYEDEIASIRRALRAASEAYSFSEEEKRAALPLYRCLKPLWFTRLEELKEAKRDETAIRRCLDRTEHFLTADIDFTDCMG